MGTSKVQKRNSQDFVSRFAPRHVSWPGGVVPLLCIKSGDISFFFIVQSPLRQSWGPRTSHSFCSSVPSRNPKRASFINTEVPSLDTHCGALKNYTHPGPTPWDPDLIILGLVAVVQWLRSVRLWPHGLQHTRLPCPSPFAWVCPSSCLLNQ